MASKGKGSSLIYGSPDSFAYDMRRIVNDEKFSDITFVVGEDKEKMYAHKNILAARCEVFQAMFAEQKQQGSKNSRLQVDRIPLVLQDIRPSVFLTVLEFIYTNSCTLTPNIAIDVMASAVEYGLEGLANCCSQFIAQNLTVEYVSRAMQAAITFVRPELREICLKFIEDNTQDVFNHRAFVEISEDTFAFILQSSNLQIDELSVLEAVYAWGAVNSVVSGKALPKQVEKVIEHVRFALLDEDALQKAEQDTTDDPKKKGTVPMRLIAKAWKYQATKKAPPGDSHFHPRAGTHM